MIHVDYAVINSNQTSAVERKWVGKQGNSLKVVKQGRLPIPADIHVLNP